MTATDAKILARPVWGIVAESVLIFGTRMTRRGENDMAGSRTRLKKAKAGRAKAARPATRLGRGKAWEQLENLWETATVSVPRDRLTRDQLHERR